VTVTDPFAPPPLVRDFFYAPGIGLIKDDTGWELIAIDGPDTTNGVPVLAAQDAVILTWPLTDTEYQAEASADLQNWIPLRQSSPPFDGRNNLTVPRDDRHSYFRLVRP